MDECGCSTKSCSLHDTLKKHGIDLQNFDFSVALAGNPNTGKSTVFNALTGLRQHTGNWPGKTVSRAEGMFEFGKKKYKLIDLPGTYSLLSASQEEEIARNFLVFGRPDVTVVVVDATNLERNLNFVLQILEITGDVVICLNLMDEAKRKGIEIDDARLEQKLGVPVIATSARYKKGLGKLVQTISGIAHKEINTDPHKMNNIPQIQEAISELVPHLEQAFPGILNSRWIAMRLIDGDKTVLDSAAGSLYANSLDTGSKVVKIEEPVTE
ncbi:50S ribosome-binding GTPase [candidate division KSB1 bacterium]|nr:50S ribosome-binding GTPase [candidate division KSB1 bacterium]MCH8286641.1 50S ribosome-binding GTPase [candidate division KSB1 bacterium]